MGESALTICPTITPSLQWKCFQIYFHVAKYDDDSCFSSYFDMPASLESTDFSILLKHSWALISKIPHSSSFHTIYDAGYLSSS